MLRSVHSAFGGKHNAELICSGLKLRVLRAEVILDMYSKEKASPRQVSDTTVRYYYDTLLHWFLADERHCVNSVSLTFSEGDPVVQK
jgi:hypothetical protein